LYGSDDGTAVEFEPGDEVMRIVAVERFSGIDEQKLKDYEKAVDHLLSAAANVNEAILSAREIVRDRQQRSDDGG
jgi:hypothetical protein